MEHGPTRVTAASDFASPVQTDLGGQLSIDAARVVAEVQGMIVSAKRFPRDETRAFTRIMKACERPQLADAACYVFPRGSTTVTGPSIRLAEVLAQSWENLDYGIREIEQHDGASIMEAYCWDIETNVRRSMKFTVPHVRDTKHGRKQLVDARDIYENNANMGARRVRACILGIIPGDVVDAAIKQCEATMAKGAGEPLADRIRKMVLAFTDLGVNQKALEKRLGHKVDTIVESEMVELKKIYRSIKDNFAARSAYFDLGGETTGAAAESNEKFAASATPNAKPKTAHEQGSLIYPSGA